LKEAVDYYLLTIRFCGRIEDGNGRREKNLRPVSLKALDTAQTAF